MASQNVRSGTADGRIRSARTIQGAVDRMRTTPMRYGGRSLKKRFVRASAVARPRAAVRESRNHVISVDDAPPVGVAAKLLDGLADEDFRSPLEIVRLFVADLEVRR